MRRESEAAGVCGGVEAVGGAAGSGRRKCAGGSRGTGHSAENAALGIQGELPCAARSVALGQFAGARAGTAGAGTRRSEAFSACPEQVSNASAPNGRAVRRGRADTGKKATTHNTGQNGATPEMRGQTRNSSIFPTDNTALTIQGELPKRSSEALRLGSSRARGRGSPEPEREGAKRQAVRRGRTGANLRPARHTEKGQPRGLASNSYAPQARVVTTLSCAATGTVGS